VLHFSRSAVHLELREVLLFSSSAVHLVKTKERGVQFSSRSQRPCSGLTLTRKRIEGTAMSSISGADFKSTLNVLSQKRGMHVRYSSPRRTGPDHKPIFDVDVLIGDQVGGSGKGPTKQQAEQLAARQALERLGQEVGAMALAMDAERDADLGALEDTLGVMFKDRSLLEKALRHRGHVADEVDSNERLEFLGDAVLSLVVAEWLLNNYPSASPKELTTIRKAAVNNNRLAEAAGECQLQRWILSGQKDHVGKERVMAGTMEAVLGAVYLDQGLEAASILAVKRLESTLTEGPCAAGARDFKGELQKYLASEGVLPDSMRDNLRYEECVKSVCSASQGRGGGNTIEEPFFVRVMFENQELGQGRGQRKRDAEQEAARIALANLMISNTNLASFEI
jgi:ribonuclease-3